MGSLVATVDAVIANLFKPNLSSVPTSFRSLKTAALTWRAFSFIIKDPDGEVVDAVGLEAREPSLAAVPTECQDLLLRLLLWFGFVEATLAVVVNLNEATRGWTQSTDSNMRLALLSNGPCIPEVSHGQRTGGRAPSAPLQRCCWEP